MELLPTQLYEDESSENKQEDRRIVRLVDIRPDRVSVVFRGANRGRFVLKSEEKEMGNEIFVEEESTDKITTENTETVDAEKQEKIPAPIQAKVAEVLTSVIERSKSLINAVKAMDATDEQMDKPLPDSCASELKAISGLMMSLLEKYPYPKVQAEKETAEQQENMITEDIVKQLIQAALADVKQVDHTETIKTLGEAMKTVQEKFEEFVKDVASLKDRVTKSERTIPDGVAALFQKTEKETKQPEDDFVFGWLPE